MRVHAAAAAANAAAASRVLSLSENSEKKERKKKKKKKKKKKRERERERKMYFLLEGWAYFQTHQAATSVPEPYAKKVQMLVVPQEISTVTPALAVFAANAAVGVNVSVPAAVEDAVPVVPDG
jgi:hypothetical protein